MEKKYKAITLCGFMFAGKSEAAKIAADETGFALCDIDSCVEEKKGLKIFEIFEKFGEKEFRRLEREAAAEAINSAAGSLIISTGGGCPCDVETFDLLQRHTLMVYLHLEFDEILGRMRQAPLCEIKKRPLAFKLSEIELFELYKLRLLSYEKIKRSVYCAGLDAKQTAKKIIEIIAKDFY